MGLFTALKQANDNRDIDALMSLYDDNFEFIRHQSGTTVRKPEYRQLIAGMFSEPSYQEIMHRCIYENDDILVEHSVMRFKDGSREPLISVKMLENGLVIRTETGASLMN
jgi:hypothetical protein